MYDFVKQMLSGGYTINGHEGKGIKLSQDSTQVILIETSV